MANAPFPNGEWFFPPVMNGMPLADRLFALVQVIHLQETVHINPTVIQVY
jgi:hypothetical protein